MRFDPHLLVRLSQRSVDHLLASVETAARKGDLPLMGTELVRPDGQDDPGLPVLLEQRYQHGGGTLTP